MNYPYTAYNDGTPTLVKADITDLFTFWAFNFDGGLRWLQMFDVADPDSEVELGTTEPVHSWPIPAATESGPGSLAIDPNVAMRFHRGLAVAVTEERDGSTPVTTPAVLNGRIG